jgi:hypothetical protein
MPARNISQIACMYKNAENLFSRLEVAVNLHENYWFRNRGITVSCLEKGLDNVDAHWLDSCGLAFKRRFKAIGKNIPDVHFVEPAIYLDIKLLKSQLKENTQNDYDMLLETVHNKILDDLKTMDSFLSTSVEQLKGNPGSLKEATLAKESLGVIKKEFIVIKTRHQACLDLLQQALKHATWSQKSEHYYRDIFSQAMNLLFEIKEVRISGPILISHQLR